MDLFDQTSLIQVASGQNPATLSKEQKAFYRFIKQIEEHRQHIQNWETTLPQIHSLIGNELEPLRERFTKARLQFIIKLDQQYGMKGLTKAENNKLQKLILHWCQDLLAADDSDPALIEVYDKHTGGDYLQEQEEFGVTMKEMLGNMFDLDLGDAPVPKSAEEMSHILSKHMLEKMQAAEEERAVNEEKAADLNAESEAPQAQTRKTSAKAQAKQAREQEEAKNTELSLREIYRKLASSLHPDREPEPQERERKTKLMQRVNMAYDQKDLLKLLELQLEIEQISEQEIQSIANSKLKHYNKILGEQLHELKGALAAFQFHFSHPSLRGALKPQTVLIRVQSDIRDLSRHVKEIEQDLTMADHISQLKNWLKNMRLSDFEDNGMFMSF
jgi:hypothetical protein